jgi:hypothetical protein
MFNFLLPERLTHNNLLIGFICIYGEFDEHGERMKEEKYIIETERLKLR